MSGSVHWDSSLWIPSVVALIPLVYVLARGGALSPKQRLLARKWLILAGLISLDDFNSGIERIVAGLERKNRLLNPREREIVAYHEMGHAIVAAAITGSDPVHKVSIIPRGVGALGYTIQRPTEDRYLMTRTELENRMAGLMGGRAAEHVVFEHFSTGAADALAKIADIARSIVTRYAMVPDFGHVALETEQRSLLGPSGEPVRQRLYGDDTARESDCAARNTVLTAFDRATAILQENRELLEQSARLLLANEERPGGAPLLSASRARVRSALDRSVGLRRSCCDRALHSGHPEVLSATRWAKLAPASLASA